MFWSLKGKVHTSPFQKLRKSTRKEVLMHLKPFALQSITLALVLASCSQQTPQPHNDFAPQATLLLHKEAEQMTNAGGCTGIQATQVTYYCNNDATYNTYNFTQNGRFSLKVRGASSANNSAGISVYLAGTKVGALNFTGTTFTDQTLTFDTTTTGSKEIRLKMETDNGSNDTLVDWYELSYEGPTPPSPPAPNPPSTGAYSSNIYRNLFTEWNNTLTATDIQNKLNTYWNSLFASTDDTKRVYYTFGSNANGPLAYIKDTGNNDIRSEGVSYGMMIAVQMNKQAEFNALWNFAKSNMQHQSGARKGYFAWQVSTAGSIMDANPASDGEEYFATALFFAGHRWGNGTGIYNYTTEANNILNTMLHKEDMNGGVVESVTNMFNKTQKQVVFVPYSTAANFTDPSYHLPAFYELWGRWATGYNGQQTTDRQFWLDAATKSRQFFASTTHSTTGLNPDYAEFTGAPNNTGNHGDFRFDAWRTAVNWSVDYAWWAADANQKTLSNKLLNFFNNQGVTAYVNQYSLAGSPLSTDRSPGLIASNGAAALASSDSVAWKFVEELWKLNPPTGQYRYYDGLLNFMALLHASGNFKIYKPGNVTPPTTTPAAPTSLAASAASNTQINLSWVDNSNNEDGFLIERKTGAAGTYAQIATASANATSYQNTGLTANTNYYYRIRARNTVGNSAYTTEVSATTLNTTSNASNPYAQLEAEGRSSQSGTVVESADGGTVVNLTSATSYLIFNGLNFGTSGAASVQFRANTTTSGVNLQIRIGSLTASPVCTVYPDSTGAWHLKSNTCYPKITGTQNVYVTTTGPVKINWFKFSL